MHPLRSGGLPQASAGLGARWGPTAREPDATHVPLGVGAGPAAAGTGSRRRGTRRRIVISDMYESCIVRRGRRICSERSGSCSRTLSRTPAATPRLLLWSRSEAHRPVHRSKRFRRVVQLSHSGTVRLVDRLEGGGLVERRRGADQRSTALLLTPSGRRAARQVLRHREARLQFIVSLLTDDQQSQLVDAAERVLGELGARPDAEQRICRLCDVDACGRSRGECPVMPARRRRHRP